MCIRDSSHTYDVSMVLTLDQGAYLDAYPAAGGDVCTYENGGLVNTAYMDETESEQPCTYPRVFRPELKLVKRADTLDGQNISNLGVKFSIFNDANGKPGDVVSGMATDGDALRATEPLQYDKKYWLVETKAPANFSLLVEPVALVIRRDTTGSARVELLENATVARSEPGEFNLAVLSVLNVRQGELPKTGGAGVGVVALVGLVIVGAGVATARRRA